MSDISQARQRALEKAVRTAVLDLFEHMGGATSFELPIDATLTIAAGPNAHAWAPAATIAGGVPDDAATFQARIGALLDRICEGDPTDLEERNYRFLEEAMELSQSFGATTEKVDALRRYVFGRAVGEPYQEAGGVMNSLGALLRLAGIDMMQAAEVELSRVRQPEVIAKIRAKRAVRPKDSSLPGQPQATAPQPAESLGQEESPCPNGIPGCPGVEFFEECCRLCKQGRAAEEFEHADAESHAADALDAAKYRALNTPEIHDFIAAVEREALHQRDLWAAHGDAGKTDADWFWLIGYLGGKAINKPEKQLHHIITTAAACLNWHGARVGAYTAMRPGIDPPAAIQPAGKQ